VGIGCQTALISALIRLQLLATPLAIFGKCGKYWVNGVIPDRQTVATLLVHNIWPPHPFVRTFTSGVFLNWS
jgi:hypothetical protein